MYQRVVRKYHWNNQKVPKGVTRRKQKGVQKDIKGQPECTKDQDGNKGEGRRSQLGNQKVPKGWAQGTKGLSRNYQRGNQNVSKGCAEGTKG